MGEYMENYKLKSVYFKKLKGLTDVNIEFEKPLTAIMGANGSGKTTVIHALSCIYQPQNSSENHRFPEFFVPNTDSLWKGSELYVVNEYTDKKGKTTILPSKKYEKAFDRWSPRYDSRPKRNVYYIGIDTCLPEIEKNTPQSHIHYSSVQLSDKISKKIIQYAGYILNKNYSALLDNAYHNKHFSGVELSSGLKYSSLSMGTGEQRTLKILEKVMNATPYSLILIDEIDLLLHVSALKRLVKQLYDIAVDHNLQIVFTTHSLDMINLSEYVSIQYISNESSKTVVYNKITTDLIYNISGNQDFPIKLYVEDEFAKAILKKIVRKIGMSSKVNVMTYGSIENAFTIAAGKVLANEDTSNTLIILDGDRYQTQEEKMAKIKSCLSGTEDNIDDRWKAALSIICQFNLPENTAPEKFLYDLLLKYGNPCNEVVIAASEINAVSDSHQWIYDIRKKLDDSEENIVRDISEIISQNDNWDNYILDIYNWLIERKDI